MLTFLAIESRYKFNSAMCVRLVFSMFLLISPVIMDAQDALTPFDQLEQLKEGVLIVRLDMKNNIKKAYQEMLDKMGRNDSQYSRTKEKLDSLNIQRLRYKQNVKEAMKSYYNFSDYCMIENQNMDFFLNGDESVLECNPAMDLDNRDFFYLIKGDRDSHWIIVDTKFARLSSPFPSSHDLGIKKFFDFLLGKNNFSGDNMNKVIEKMNERLMKYYLKVK